MVLPTGTTEESERERMRRDPRSEATATEPTRLQIAGGKWMKRINENLAGRSIIGISQAGMRREELRNIFPRAYPDVTDSFMGEPEHMRNYEQLSPFAQKLTGEILPAFAESPVAKWFEKQDKDGLESP